MAVGPRSQESGFGLAHRRADRSCEHCDGQERLAIVGAAATEPELSLPEEPTPAFDFEW